MILVFGIDGKPIVLMLVLVFLYKVTVWLVTMVTHSLATDFIKNGKPTYFREDLKNNTKLLFLYEKDHIPCQYIKIFV